MDDVSHNFNILVTITHKQNTRRLNGEMLNLQNIVHMANHYRKIA